MGQEIDMPDARFTTLGNLRDWCYNGGSYGRKPTYNEICEKGWGRLVDSGILFWNSTNADLRYREPGTNGSLGVLDDNSADMASKLDNIQLRLIDGATSAATYLKDIHAILADVHDAAGHHLEVE